MTPTTARFVMVPGTCQCRGGSAGREVPFLTRVPPRRALSRFCRREFFLLAKGRSRGTARSIVCSSDSSALPSTPGRIAMLERRGALCPASTSSSQSSSRMPGLTRAERRLLRLSLHALGRALELPVEPSVDDSANMARSFHAPLWRVRRMFRSEAAFRSFVARKLDQADERASVRRIAAIFSGVTDL